MKKTSRRLQLRREDVRRLTPTMLARVRGGSAENADDVEDWIHTYNRVCVTGSENCDVVESLMGLGGTSTVVTFATK
jgi:hypothetical protein